MTRPSSAQVLRLLRGSTDSRRRGSSITTIQGGARWCRWGRCAMKRRPQGSKLSSWTKSSRIETCPKVPRMSGLSIVPWSLSLIYNIPGASSRQTPLKLSQCLVRSRRSTTLSMRRETRCSGPLWTTGSVTSTPDPQLLPSTRRPISGVVLCRSKGRLTSLSRIVQASKAAR